MQESLLDASIAPHNATMHLADRKCRIPLVELLHYSVCSGLISLSAPNLNMSLFPEQRSK